MNKNPLIKCLLAPLSFVYFLITWLRNLLFEWKVLPSEQFNVPVICIGNISVGGTGKTPFTEYLITTLKDQYRVAVLSRGYKRKTKGFLIASENCETKEAGDEACQIKKKHPDIIVAVDANRRRGIKKLLALPEGEKPDVILLDDAMQHRYVRPSLTIMLTEYNQPYYEDSMLPAGHLRESVRAIYRADIIVVTKCGRAFKPIERRIMEKNMMLMANQQLYFSHIKYHGLKPLFPENADCCKLSELTKNEEIILIAGVANPVPFIKMIKSYSDKAYVYTFPDHHAFKTMDIKKLDAVFQKISSSAPGRIICTEKDAMRLKNMNLPQSWKPHLYYVPISVEFLFNRAEDFDARILKHVLSTINIKKKNAKN